MRDSMTLNSIQKWKDAHVTLQKVKKNGSLSSLLAKQSH